MTAASAPSDPDLTAQRAADTATRTNSILGLYRNVWLHADGARGRLLGSTVMLTGSQVIKLAIPWMAAQAINGLQKQGVVAASATIWWILAILAVSALTWCLHGPGRVLERKVGVQVRRSMADALYARLARAPLTWHDRHHSGEVQHRMGQATIALSDFAQTQFVYLQNAVNLLGPLVALAMLSWLAGGVALAGYVTIGAVIIAFDKALMRRAVQENNAERRYGAALLDCLSNISTVMSLRLHGSTRRLLGKRMDAVFEPLKSSIVLTEWKWCCVDLMTVTLAWGLVVVYAWSGHQTEALLLGNLFMVYQYAQQAGGVIGSLAQHFQNFARVRTNFASAEPLWQAPQREAQADPATVDQSWNRIELRDLTFAHQGADEALVEGEADRRGGVRGVSFSLKRGERLALVGPSGSGKSTLLRVMAGLYEAGKGHVAFDDVACLGTRHLAGVATFIPQEAEVFEATVRENIAFDLAHDDLAVARAAHVSSFDTVLSRMPQGLDTFISEGGANLSGGQRQRLCLARGVLAAKGSSLLLLDEPTSALDPLTEAQVHRRLDHAFPDACIVASVHRMSLLAHFDRVAFMVQGELLDIGTVDEVRARQPLFQEMLGHVEVEESLPAVA